MNNYKVKSMLRYLFHRISINLIFSPTICPSRIFIRPSFEEKSSKILINLKPTSREYFHWFLFSRYFTNVDDLSRIFICSAFEKMLSRNGHLKIFNISVSWTLALISIWTTIVHDLSTFVHPQFSFVQPPKNMLPSSDNFSKFNSSVPWTFSLIFRWAMIIHDLSTSVYPGFSLACPSKQKVIAK